jgi:hypothetical protein
VTSSGLKIAGILQGQLPRHAWTIESVGEEETKHCNRGVHARETDPALPPMQLKTAKILW